MHDDPERIYLEPGPNFCPIEGRQWCEQDVWPVWGDGPSGVPYIRADIVADLCDTAQDLIAACEQMGEDSAPIFEEIAQRGAPYKGQQIGPELAAMKEALGRAKSALRGGVK